MSLLSQCFCMEQGKLSAFVFLEPQLGLLYMKQLSNSIASQTLLPIKIEICLCEHSHSQLKQKAPSPQPITVTYQRPFKVLMAPETDSFSFRNRKAEEKEMEITSRKRRNEHQYWIAVRRPLISTNDYEISASCWCWVSSLSLF